MKRLDFLRALALGGAGLLVGDKALDAFERLTHKRKHFPGWTKPEALGTVRIPRDGGLLHVNEMKFIISNGAPGLADLGIGHRAGTLYTLDDGLKTYTDMRVTRFERDALSTTVVFTGRA